MPIFGIFWASSIAISYYEDLVRLETTVQRFIDTGEHDHNLDHTPHGLMPVFPAWRG